MVIKKRILSIFKIIALSIVGLLLIAAVLINIIRWHPVSWNGRIPWMSHYLSRVVGAPVNISGLELTWHQGHPSIVLKNVALNSKAAQLTLPTLTLNIALWPSLYQRQLDVLQVGLQGLSGKINWSSQAGNQTWSSFAWLRAVNSVDISHADLVLCKAKRCYQTGKQFHLTWRNQQNTAVLDLSSSKSLLNGQLHLIFQQQKLVQVRGILANKTVAWQQTDSQKMIQLNDVSMHGVLTVAEQLGFLTSHDVKAMGQYLMQNQNLQRINIFLTPKNQLDYIQLQLPDAKLSVYYQPKTAVLKITGQVSAVQTFLKRLRLNKQQPLGEFLQGLQHGSMDHIYFELKNAQASFAGSGHDMTWAFLPHWPALKHFSGHLSWQKNGLHISNAYSYWGRFPLNAFELHYYPKSNRLSAVTNSSGRLSRLLALLQTLPIHHFIPSALNWQAKGRVRFHLRLDWLLANNKPSYQGWVQYLGDHFSADHMPFKIDNLLGRLWFNNDVLTMKNAHMLVNDKPWVASLHTEKNGAQLQYHAAITGKIAPQELLQAIGYHAPIKITGDADFRANLQLAQNRSLSAADFYSNLQGVAIAIPKLYSKKAKDHAALTLSWQKQSATQGLLNVAYAHKAKARIMMTMKQHKIAVSGDVAWLRDLPSTTMHPGIDIYMNVSRLTLHTIKQWLAVDFGAGQAMTDLDKLYLNIDQLSLFGYPLNQVAANIADDSGVWTARLQGNRIQGDVYFTPAQHLLATNLNRLFLFDQQSQHDSSMLSFSSLPSLNLHVAKLYWQGKSLQKFELQAKPQSNRLMLNDWRFNYLGCGLNMHGAWQIGKQAKSNLIGGMACQDFGYFFRHMHWFPNMTGGQGEATFALLWPGNLSDIDSDALQADIKLNITNGSIVHLSASQRSQLGLGKLLNLFSLSAIPQHLSNLQGNGYDFDQLTGEIRLVKQIATIVKPLQFFGSVADIKLTGKLLLKRRYYDLYAELLPHVTGSLPLIATVAGGPVAGLATFLVDQLISPGVSHAVEKRYHIHGTWQRTVAINRSLPLPN